MMKIFTERYFWADLKTLELMHLKFGIYIGPATFTVQQKIKLVIKATTEFFHDDIRENSYEL